MDAQRFVEVETPMLIASTPEGARDFVVPSRLHPGEFYALPQSPQLFKQLLMVGGLERYFQIARCLRDEDLRADRQFEFMQYDMEMSFAGAADVQAVVTEAVGAAVEAVTGERPGEFSRMTWQDAMDRYGSDKPDIRFGLEITDLATVFASTGFRAFQAEAVRGICVPGRGDMGRNKRDGLIDRAKALGAMGLVSFKVEGGALVGNGIQHLSADEQGDLLRTLGAVDGDLVLIVAGAPRMVSEVLGALRLDLARPPVNEGGLHFSWIDDFPLFEGLTDDGSPIPAHHPFTMPHPDDLELLATAEGEDLLKVRSLSYDLVLNGWELGSGSVRIHTPDVQRQIFTLLGISDETAAERFGFLLEAFRYGAPPHAGFAFGTDRLAGPARRRGEHPRGHRLPQDPVGRRPPHRRPHPHRPGPTARPRPPTPTPQALSPTPGRWCDSRRYPVANRTNGCGCPRPRCKSSPMSTERRRGAAMGPGDPCPGARGRSQPAADPTTRRIGKVDGRSARGVYAIAGTPPSWEQSVMAAVLAAGDGAVASHSTAGALWGLPNFDRDQLEVSTARRDQRRLDGVVTHRTNRFLADEHTTVARDSGDLVRAERWSTVRAGSRSPNSELRPTTASEARSSSSRMLRRCVAGLRPAPGRHPEQDPARCSPFGFRGTTRARAPSRCASFEVSWRMAAPNRCSSIGSDRARRSIESISRTPR